jgi:hypothetical protein
MSKYEMPRKRILCADGFSMSVQASGVHYCEPPVTGLGFYSKYEVGFPSVPHWALGPYANDPDNPTETVYGWVPVEVIAQVVADHGGVVGECEYE